MTAEELRDLRRKTGLSQQKFAKRFHLGIRAVQSWEQGRTRMPEPISYLLKEVVRNEGIGDMEPCADRPVERLAGSVTGRLQGDSTLDRMGELMKAYEGLGASLNALRSAVRAAERTDVCGMPRENAGLHERVSCMEPDVFSLGDRTSMEGTGIIRRIDDLGRVALPVSIRNFIHVSDGDPMEIFVNVDGKGVTLRKYEPETE